MLKKTIEKLNSYQDIVTIISNKINKMRLVLNESELITINTEHNSSSRIVFYKNINNYLSYLEKAKEFKLEVDKSIVNDFPGTHDNCMNKLEKKIERIAADAQLVLTKLYDITQDQKNQTEVCNIFKNYYTHLMDLRANIKPLQLTIDKRIGEIKIELYKHLDQMRNNISEHYETDQVALLLVKLKRSSDLLYMFKKDIDDRIDHIIDEYRLKKKASAAPLHDLYVALSKRNGSNVIAGHKQFKGDLIADQNKHLRQFKIDYVLENLETGVGYIAEEWKGKKRTKLEECYKIFEANYERLKASYLKPDNIDFSGLRFQIQSIVDPLKKKFQLENSENITWDLECRDVIPKLLAYLFVLWTLQHSVHYFKDSGEGDRELYLLKPHAAQVIALFRMFNLDYQSTIDNNVNLILDNTINPLFGSKLNVNTARLENNLVQVLTGEGKSIILAIAASLLALLGMDVSCACYSTYLSERDFENFKWLFDMLKITDRIHYGTFNNLCERIINKNGQLRTEGKRVNYRW